MSCLGNVLIHSLLSLWDMIRRAKGRSIFTQQAPKYTHTVKGLLTGMTSPLWVCNHGYKCLTQANISTLVLSLLSPFPLTVSVSPPFSFLSHFLFHIFLFWSFFLLTSFLFLSLCLCINKAGRMFWSGGNTEGGRRDAETGKCQ